MQTLESTPSLYSAAFTPAGTWRLAPQKAITLVPAIDGKISPKMGGLWITCSHPKSSTATDPRAHDIFLAQGETMVIPQGAMVVIEPWGVNLSEPCYFTWDAVTPALTLPLRTANNWTLQIAQPWQDLKTALGQVVSAAGRLVRGAVRWTWQPRGLAECSHGPAQI